ncbi:MAG: DegT/DnrJ/EryC1/StrS family aminotransferase [Gemmatimonadales bacterium]
MVRHQLPAWSPVSLGSVRAGVAARGDAGALDHLAGILRDRLGASAVALTGSGTLALGLAMRAAGRAARPRICLPAYGCFDLATAADFADAEVRLYDLEPRTLSPAPESLERALGGGADAVVVAHLFGVPVATAAVRARAAAAGAILIDDAAQGVGATVEGRPAGAGGQLGVLSFGRGKGRTGGRGGALLAFEPEIGARIGSLVSGAGRPPAGGFGEALKLAAQWLLGRPGVYAIPASIPWLRLGETLYHQPPSVEPLSRFAAGVLLHGIQAVEEENRVRAASAERWTEALAGLAGIERVEPPLGSGPGWLRYPVIVEPELVAVLSTPAFRRLGVMPGYPKTLAALEGFEGRLGAIDTAAFPGAALLAGRLFTLPTHSRVRPRDREALLGAIRSVAR